MQAGQTSSSTENQGCWAGQDPGRKEMGIRVWDLPMDCLPQGARKGFVDRHFQSSHWEVPTAIATGVAVDMHNGMMGKWWGYGRVTDPVLLECFPCLYLRLFESLEGECRWIILSALWWCKRSLHSVKALLGVWDPRLGIHSPSAPWDVGLWQGVQLVCDPVGSHWHCVLQLIAFRKGHGLLNNLLWNRPSV